MSRPWMTRLTRFLTAKSRLASPVHPVYTCPNDPMTRERLEALLRLSPVIPGSEAGLKIASGVR